MPASAAWKAASLATAVLLRRASDWIELSIASERTPIRATISTISTIVTPSSRRSVSSLALSAVVTGAPAVRRSSRR
jgi:hypothetical protein